MELSLLDVLLITLDRLALATIIGCSAAFCWLLLDSDDARITVLPILRRLLDGALITLVLTTAAVLLMRTAIMADVALLEAFPYVAKVAEKSHFGTLWIGRAAALTAMIAIWLVVRRQTPPFGGILLLTGSAIIAFYISTASHAGDEGGLTLDNLTNSAHIIGGCLWGGAVIAYLVVINRLRREEEMHEALCLSADRLTALATVALATVITSGLLNTWHRLEAISDLWMTDYGITLVIKLLLVAMMMAIGAGNRFIIIPAMKNSAAASGRFHRILYLDATLFTAIIGIAAALGIQGPGEH